MEAEDEQHPKSTDPDEFTNVCLGKKRRKLFAILEQPQTSKLALGFSALSMIFIALSVLGSILGSLPQCQDQEGKPHRSLVILEQACAGWFTLEFLLRLTVAGDRCKFFKSALNIIDLISILPFYLELFMTSLAVIEPKQMQSVKGALLTMRILRVVRVARVLKFARYSSGMQNFGAGLRNSKEEFGLVVICLSVSILLFSTTVYYVEKGSDNTPFTTIPSGFWWCVVTMTTVGYGDMVPVTDLGKVVASIATVSGVVVLAYPITMIVGKFNSSHKKYKRRKERHNVDKAIVTLVKSLDPFADLREMSLLKNVYGSHTTKSQNSDNV